jgi:hypothetical protein
MSLVGIGAGGAAHLPQRGSIFCIGGLPLGHKDYLYLHTTPDFFRCQQHVPRHNFHAENRFNPPAAHGGKTRLIYKLDIPNRPCKC